MPRAFLGSLMLFTALASLSFAGPVQVTIEGTIGNPGDKTYQTIDTTQTLPDGYSPNGTTYMGLDHYFPIPGAGSFYVSDRIPIGYGSIGPDNPSFVPANAGSSTAPFHNPVDEPFQISLTFQPTTHPGGENPSQISGAVLPNTTPPTSTTPAGVGPTILLQGTVTGDIGGEGWDDRLGGGYRGAVTSATLSGWTPDSGVPQSLLDLFLNPANLQVSSIVSGGSSNLLFITLGVDPAPVPEPTLSLMFATVLAGLQIRRWRSRRAA